MVREREEELRYGGLFPFPRLLYPTARWRNCEITEWEEGAEKARGGGKMKGEEEENISEGRRTRHLIMEDLLTFCPRLYYLAHHPVPVLIDPDDLEVDFECK